MYLKGRDFALETSLSTVLASTWGEGWNEKLGKDIEK